MLGKDKKVDAAYVRMDQDEQTVTQKDNKKRNTIIGVSSALAVVATLLTTSVATGGLTKPDADAKKVEGLNLLQVSAAQPPLGLELATSCTPKSLPVEAIQQTCSFSVDRFLKGQSLDINSEEFLCTVGSDGLYTDPTFPATIEGMMYWKSLGDTDMTRQITSVNKWYGGLKFVRPTQIPKERGGGPNPSLWGEKGVQPLAAVQGRVGDCWFLSAAAAVAETPSRIYSLFENTSYPENGAFQVYFHIGGKRQKVIIDDLLPAFHYKKEKDSLYASKASPAGAWWTVILEKAGAKLFANYDGLTAGQASSALRLLTGMPTSSWKSKELAEKGDDFLWKIIMKGTKNNWPMTTATTWQAPNYLMPNHVYTVLEGMQLSNADGSEGPKLVKIRNPHGDSRYNSLGPWKRDSDKWTASYLEQTGYTKKWGSMEGEFWFPLELFTKDWEGIDVAHYNENFFDSNMAPQAYTPIKEGSIKGIDQATIDSVNRTAKTNSYYTLTNTVVQDVYITCDQLFDRMFPTQDPKCAEKPLWHWFTFYKKFVPFGIEKPELYDETPWLWCNRNAQVIENMPVGEYMISVSTSTNLDRKSSFELQVNAEQAKVAVAYKDYDLVTLYGLNNCVKNSQYCDLKICSVKEFQYKTKENCKAEKAAKEAAKKAESEYGGVGHWLMTWPGNASPSYCLQANGDSVGTEKVSKHFIDQQKPFTFSTLSKGTCVSVGWVKDTDGSYKYDGVTARTWRQY